MLILTRRKGEEIVLSVGTQTVIVKVHDVIGGKIRIGIDAPLMMGVHRMETWEAIHGARPGNRPQGEVGTVVGTPAVAGPAV